MENSVFLNVESDIFSLILCFIIHDIDDFFTFGRLLMAYLTKQTSHRIKDILERLNWDALYQYHQHELEVTRDRFSGFIEFAVRHGVQQAMFYDSVQKLFRSENVQHNLSVLSSLSGSHFPSSFSFIFFKAIYRPFEREQTVKEMSLIFHTKYLHSKLLDILNLLQEMYTSISEFDYLLPVYKFCPNASNKDPIYQLEGPPFEEELWYSLCHMTVQGKYREDGELFGRPLRISHIFDTQCDCCRVQLILYKILLSSCNY